MWVCGNATHENEQFEGIMDFVNYVGNCKGTKANKIMEIVTNLVRGTILTFYVGRNQNQISHKV